MEKQVNIRERARQQTGKITAYINEQIASGQWGAGDKLPTDRELAARFGIARNTVRRTLEQLERDRLIVRQVGRGTFVAERDSGTAPAPTASGQVDLSPSDVMELRLMVEPQMAELIVLRATPRDIAALDECITRSESARSHHEYEKWDEALHRTLAECTKNNGVLTIMETINAQRNQPAWINLKKRTLTHGVRQVYQRQHRAIVDAVKTRDRQATQAAIREHLLEVRRQLLGEG